VKHLNLFRAIAPAICVKVSCELFMLCVLLRWGFCVVQGELDRIPHFGRKRGGNIHQNQESQQVKSRTQVYRQEFQDQDKNAGSDDFNMSICRV
jgi:hypothetical protein